MITILHFSGLAARYVTATESPGRGEAAKKPENFFRIYVFPPAPNIKVTAQGNSAPPFSVGSDGRLLMCMHHIRFAEITVPVTVCMFELFCMVNVDRRFGFATTRNFAAAVRKFDFYPQQWRR